MARRFQSQEHKPEFNSIPDSSLFNSPLLIPQNRQMSSLRQLLAKMQEFPVSLVFDWKKSGVALDATPRAQKERQAMKKTLTHDERIAKLTFTGVYPYLLAKVEKKNRTKAELHEVIRWLTGYTEKALEKHIQKEISFTDFFAHAKLNPNARLITGTICGYRVEEIENPLSQQVRYLDKLVDELAKGRPMGKILRSE